MSMAGQMSPGAGFNDYYYVRLLYSYCSDNTMQKATFWYIVRTFL